MYPRQKFHPIEGEITVRSYAEEAALPDGWYDTPEHFPKQAEVKKPESVEPQPQIKRRKPRGGGLA